MKVTVKSPSKPVANGVQIDLTDCEAGFLRRICLEQSSKYGVLSNLFDQLDQFEFPEYEHRFPNWRQWEKKLD